MTHTKAFCGCVNKYGGEPNTHVCPTCLGLPGALPVLNRQAVEYAVLAATAIHCEIRERSVFGAQELLLPGQSEGVSDLAVRQADRGRWMAGCAVAWRVEAHRHHAAAHEEDAGKSLHDGFADSVSNTYIDLNRCGTPLLEIVSEPDLRSADEVFEYLTRLKEILLYTV